MDAAAMACVPPRVAAATPLPIKNARRLAPSVFNSSFPAIALPFLLLSRRSRYLDDLDDLDPGSYDS
jgi:hypothetical protein